MRTHIHLLLVLVCSASALLQATGLSGAPLAEAIKVSQAVACVRVTHVTEELREDHVQHAATLTLCGRSAGLEGQPQIEVAWELPVEYETKMNRQHPKFVTGERWIVLFANNNEHWEVVYGLGLSPEGRIVEDPGEEIGYKPGMDADAVVQLIAARLEKPRRRPPPRSTPPSVSGRNQPWKLMRTSPLRRVWPFFPH